MLMTSMGNGIHGTFTSQSFIHQGIFSVRIIAMASRQTPYVAILYSSRNLFCQFYKWPCVIIRYVAILYSSRNLFCLQRLTFCGHKAEGCYVAILYSSRNLFCPGFEVTHAEDPPNFPSQSFIHQGIFSVDLSEKQKHALWSFVSQSFIHQGIFSV